MHAYENMVIILFLFLRHQIRSTALARPLTLYSASGMLLLASVAPRRTTGRSSAQPMTWQWKSTACIRIVSQYV